MYTYLDKNRTMLVAEGTLISFSGSTLDVQIPAHPEPGLDIRSIGTSAFHGNHTVTCIKLPETLESIGDSAFSECTSLKGIEIPDGVVHIGSFAFSKCKELCCVELPATLQTVGRLAFSDCPKLHEINARITAEKYRQLLGYSRKCHDGLICVTEPSHIPLLRDLIAAIGGKAIDAMPADIPILFQDAVDPGACKRRSVYGESNALCFDQHYGAVSEDKAFRRQIRGGCISAGSPEAERQNDWYLRAEKTPPFEKVTIPLFRAEQAEESNRHIKMTLTFRTGWWFWQSARRVSWRGKEYYVYSRNYLTSDPQIPYYRLDMAVYDGEGLVTDRRLSREIYAKYKLLALL